MNNEHGQVPEDPMVNLILELAQQKKLRTLKEIRNLIYQPFRSRYHPVLFKVLPDKEAVPGVTYYSFRQAYRLVGPLMAGYPRMARGGNFGRSLAKLELVIGQNTIERKLLIIRQSLKLHWAESTLLRLVTLMQADDILIDWHQFVMDARYWNEITLGRWYEELFIFRNRKERSK